MIGVIGKFKVARIDDGKQVCEFDCTNGYVIQARQVLKSMAQRDPEAATDVSDAVICMLWMGRNGVDGTQTVPWNKYSTEGVFEWLSTYSYEFDPVSEGDEKNECEAETGTSA